MKPELGNRVPPHPLCDLHAVVKDGPMIYTDAEFTLEVLPRIPKDNVIILDARLVHQ